MKYNRCINKQKAVKVLNRHTRQKKRQTTNSKTELRIGKFVPPNVYCQFLCPLSKVEVVQIQIHMFIRLARCCQNVGFAFLGRVTEYYIFGLSEQINRIRTEHWIHRIWFTHPYKGMNHRATPARKRKDSVTTIGPQLPKGRKDPSENRTTPAGGAKRSIYRILFRMTDIALFYRFARY